MKELGKLRPWVALGLIVAGFSWHGAWFILAGLILIDWAGDRWKELLDAIRGKPKPLSETKQEEKRESIYETDCEDFNILWVDASEETKQELRTRWRNLGLEILAKSPTVGGKQEAKPPLEREREERESEKREQEARDFLVREAEAVRKEREEREAQTRSRGSSAPT